MAITLIEGFKNLTEGKEQTLLIKKVTYDRKYDKCKVKFVDDNYGSCTETFTFSNSQGKVNEMALRIFSVLAYCATHDFTIRDIEPEEIEGKYIVADVTVDHVKNEETGEMRHYYHVRNFREADRPDAVDADIDDEDDDDDPFA